ncbi:MAG TPA: GntR family transcriptional regulator [Streptosporangiaceae bacterium]|nr:GntR family transcriptional regulator [Streptosporangiaceae bacterium]
MVKGTAELQRPIPLYMQVVRQLRAQIASGELAEGERIPSQREMMQHWRISMQTASKVIGALKTEGLAIPSIGRDTIVAPGAAARIAAAAAGTAQATAEQPADADYDVRATAEVIIAPVRVVEMLGIPSGSRALRRQETRLDSGTPVSVTATWFPQTITDKAPRLADSKALPGGAFAYLTEAAQSRVTRITEDRAALTADKQAAESLNVPPGSPVLLIRARHFSLAGEVIAYSETTVPAGTWHSFSYEVR